MDTPKQGWTPYVVYTTKILLQTVKGVEIIKLVHASNPGHLLHTPFPYPLNQPRLADENGNF